MYTPAIPAVRPERAYAIMMYLSTSIPTNLAAS